jgi:transcriptional regulator with XRE-family HTH domain
MEIVELKVWRNRKKLTQTQAAAMLHVHLSQYQRWEHGGTPIPPLVDEYIKASQKLEDLQAEIEELRAALPLV